MVDRIDTLERTHVRNKCAKTIVNFDVSRKVWRSLMPDGESVFRTKTGAVITIIIYFLLAIYGGYRFSVVASRNEYKILEENQAYFYGREEIVEFGNDDGFVVAATITGHDMRPDEVVDPSIGQLKFIIKSWDQTSDRAADWLRFKELGTRPCTDNDFAETDSSPFYKLKEQTQAMQTLARSMTCISEKFQLWGDYDSEKASNLMIVFENCNPRYRECKSEAEINAWMDRKYILVIENEKNFIQFARDKDNLIGKLSKPVWISLSPQMRIDFPNRIELIEAQFDSTLISGNFVTQQTCFHSTELPSRTMPYADEQLHFQTAITYELWDTKTIYVRNDYTLFAALADIGGLEANLTSVGFLLIGFIAVKGPLVFTTSALITQKRRDLHRTEKDDERGDEDEPIYDYEQVQHTCCFFMRMRCARNKCCFCLKLRKKKDNVLMEAVEDVKHEYRVTNIVKNIRVLEGLIRESVSKEEWIQAFKKYSRVSIKKEVIEEVNQSFIESREPSQDILEDFDYPNAKEHVTDREQETALSNKKGVQQKVKSGKVLPEIAKVQIFKSGERLETEKLDQ